MQKETWRYYNAVDQISNAVWAANKQSRFVLFQGWVRELFPKGCKTKFVQVVGTSGKGSTTRFLEAGFGVYGKSGSLTSPHLFDYRERIHIGGVLVSAADMVWAWEVKVFPLCVRAALADETSVPTFSEIFLLIALVLFEKYRVEWGILEASVGGRYDITSALPAKACVLTNIGEDHLSLLGEYSWQRALDKGGVIRDRAPFFTGEEDGEHVGIFRELCSAAKSDCFVISDREVAEVKKHINGFEHSLGSSSYQQKNIALAFSVLHYFFPKISEEKFVKMCAQMEIPGRFSASEEVIFDVAHNPDKLRVFVEHLKQRYSRKKHVFVFGVSGDRDGVEHARIIAPVARAVFLTGGFHKSQTRAELVRMQKFLQKKSIAAKIFDVPEEAFASAKRIIKKGECVVLTGSTYMIDQILNPDPYMKFLNTQYGWRTPENREMR